MRLLYASEHRLDRTPDGQHWSEASFTSALARYRHSRIHITALVRVREVDTAPTGRSVVPPDVHIAALPAYRGLRGTVVHSLALRRRAIDAVRAVDLVVVRAPGIIGYRVGRASHRFGRRLLAEIVGDPAAAFSGLGSSHPARRAIAVVASWQLRWIASHADITCYVTASALQERYPPRPDAPTFAISNIVLAQEDLATARATAPASAVTMVSIAAMEQPYKRVDWTIEVGARLVAHGIEARVVIVGDGDLRAQYESLAAASSVDCRFVGHLSRTSVLAQLDEADVYVSTSAVEGLPRAVLEAMARGLPSFAFPVGGTTQLAPGVRLHDVGDIEGMAQDIASILTDQKRYAQASSDAIATASGYTIDALIERTRALRAALWGDLV